MSQPKGKKSNNKKKPGWHCFTSEGSMLRQMRGIGLFSWMDVYKPKKSLMQAIEQDVLQFINRECAALRKHIKK